MGTPSMTKRGALPALTDEAPRIRIVEPPPGDPSLDVTWTPGILPAMASWGLTTAERLKSSEPTRSTAPVRSRSSTSP